MSGWKYLIFLFMIIMTTLQGTKCGMCLPGTEYEAKDVFLNATLDSSHTVIMPHLGMCGEYCFKVLKFDIAYFISTRLCSCLTITDEHAKILYTHNESTVPIKVISFLYNNS